MEITATINDVSRVGDYVIVNFTRSDTGEVNSISLDLWSQPSDVLSAVAIWVQQANNAADMTDFQALVGTVVDVKQAPALVQSALAATSNSTEAVIKLDILNDPNLALGSSSIAPLG